MIFKRGEGFLTFFSPIFPQPLFVRRKKFKKVSCPIFIFYPIPQRRDDDVTNRISSKMNVKKKKNVYEGFSGGRGAPTKEFREPFPFYYNIILHKSRFALVSGFCLQPEVPVYIYPSHSLMGM